MPIFSASSTCVSLRWRRSCRIFRPTSSSWAGLFMRVSLTFMLLKNKLATNLRTAAESVKSGGSHDQESPPPPGARPPRPPRPSPRRRVGHPLARPPAAEPRSRLLVRLHLYVHTRTGGGG